jgi:hypothetical protein
MKAFPNPMTLDRNGKTVENQVGMDLRDYFAAKAMQALVAKTVNDNEGPEVTAEAAYMFADAMLEARDAFI